MARSAKKAEFVKKHIDKTPAEIIAAGAAHGLTLSQSYIGKLRTERKRSGPVIIRSVRRVKPHAEHPARAEFSALVWRLGTMRVREWLAALEREASRDDEHV